MPLQKQTVALSFAGGLETKADPKQVPTAKLLSLTNGVFTSPGKIGKRFGYSSVGPPLGSLGTTPQTLLTQFNSETVASDRTSLFSYSPDLNVWENKGLCMSLGVSRDSVARSRSGCYAPTVALNGSFLCYVYQSGATTPTIAYTVKDMASGETIISDQVIVSGGTYSNTVRVCAIANYFLVFYATTSYFVYQTLNITNLSAGWSAATNITTSSGLGGVGDQIDAVYNAPGNYIAIVTSANGTTTQSVFGLSSTLVLTSNIAFASVSVDCIGIFSDSVRSDFCVAYRIAGGNVTYAIFDNILGITGGPTAITFPAGQCDNITGYMQSDVGALYWSWVNPSSALPYTQYATFNVGVASAAALLAGGLSIASKPAVVSTVPYFFAFYNAVNKSGVSANNQAIYYLIRPTLSANGAGMSFQAVARIAQEDGALLNAWTRLSIPDLFQLGTGSAQYLTTFAMASRTLNNISAKFDTGIDGVTFDFQNSTNGYQSAQIANVLHVNGGMLQMYDGAQVVEEGFHYPPAQPVLNFGSGGSLTNGGLYQWVSVYEWVDAKGATHQSAPSAAASGTASSPNLQAGLSVPYLRLTAKPNVVIRWYRTLANGTVFYCVNPATPSANNTAGTSSGFTDGNSDTSISANPILYTEQQVAASPGPPCTAMTVYHNRLLLVDAEQPLQVWYSLQVVPGQPAQMSDQLIQNMDPAGGPCTALGVMDDKLLISKAALTYYMTGDGPDATGANSNFSTPLNVNPITGCIYPGSTVTSEGGMGYQSAKGIRVLGRGLQEQYIGEGVEALTNFQQVISADIIPYTNEVRFDLASGTTLVWDQYLQQWSSSTYSAASGMSGMHSAAAVINGAYAFLLQATGQLYQEQTNHYADVSSTPIVTKLTTAWIQLGGLQGFQRVYKLLLVGNCVGTSTLTVGIAYDFNSTIVQTDTITVGTSPYQIRVFLQQQKCEAIQVTLTDTPSSTTQGMDFAGLTFEIGVKRGPYRLPATQSYG